MLFIYTLREPNATDVQNKGFGHVVLSVGALAGNVPYTAYNAKKSYIENNEEIIKSFNKAINKGLDYVNNNSSEEIASKILKYFPDTSLNDLVKSIDSYKSISAWKENTYISEEDFNRLQDIMINSKQLEKYSPYTDLINTKYMNSNE